MSYTNREFTWDLDKLREFFLYYVLAPLRSLVGYYECGTAASQAAKTVAAVWYSTIREGGSMKIKFTYKNTAASGVTLKIGSAAAKPLYYEGAAVDATNTWGDGETVEVYYDGTRYYANNVAGGNEGDGVIDISAKTGNSYETLTAALSAVPENKRAGGMSVKYIQKTNVGTQENPSYEYEYVQYRLKTTAWSITVTDWDSEIVDDSPTSDSNNLVKSGGVFTAIRDASTQFAYAECSTAANVAAKTISLSGYVLTVGGSMKIKFTYKNTAASGVTLKIGSATAKPLYYKGAAVDATNTWDDGETVEVYYDGTRYYANNVAGGNEGDGVIDISAKTGNSYETLSAALSAARSVLLASEKKGGMSIKFIQSLDNKYAQYRYMLQYEDTTAGNNNFVNDDNWQKIGVDGVQIENILIVAEDGFYLVDENYYIGGYENEYGGNMINTGGQSGITYTVV